MTSRGLLAGLLDRELTGTKREQQRLGGGNHMQQAALAILTTPFLCHAGFCVPGSYTHAFSCSGQHAGVIKVDPDGDPCPPYAITYNQVSGLGVSTTL